MTSSTTPVSGGKFVLRAVDFDRSNGGAFKRGKQNAAKRVPNGVAVTGFKRLGDELGVGFCGRTLLFGESFRHFKTTVTNWHMIFEGDFG